MRWRVRWQEGVTAVAAYLTYVGTHSRYVAGTSGLDPPEQRRDEHAGGGADAKSEDGDELGTGLGLGL